MTIERFVFIKLLPATATLCALLGVLTTSVQASPNGRTAPACTVGAKKSLISSQGTFAVDALGLVRVHRKPGGAAFVRFGPLNLNGVPMVFAALDAVLGARCKASWYRVMLPLKPNGQVGYVRARAVRLRRVQTRVVVDLSTRRLTVFDRGKPVLTAKTAIGARATPTPVGRFYVNQRFLSDASGPYGWAAIGISAFSETLRGWPQGGPVAIHGTNRPSLIGLPVSNGCIRVSNDVVKKLWRLAPTGTPVLVQV